MEKKYSVIIPGSRDGEEKRAAEASLKAQSIPPEAVLLPGEPDANTGINASLREIDTPFVWILSPGALPSDADTAAKMLAPFEDEGVAAVYSKQRAEAGKTGVSEAWQAAFFPDTDSLKEEKDVYSRGMETFFLSHVSCMYRVEDLRKLPPFEPFSLSFAEHIAGAELIHMGKKIVYKADAEVKYLHRITPGAALHEGFDYGVLEKRNIQDFGLYVIDDGSYGVIGRNLGEIYRDAYRDARKWLVDRGGILKVPGAWLVYLFLKYGNMAGRRYHRLPAKLNRAMISKKDFFV